MNGLLSGLFPHPAGKMVHTNDGAFVQAAGDDFAFVTGGDLKRHFAVLGVNHPSSAMNGLAYGCGRKVAQLDFCANGTFVVFETTGHRFAGGAFEKADEIRRGQHGGHAVGGKINGVLRLDLESQFGCQSNSRSVFHFGCAFKKHLLPRQTLSHFRLRWQPAEAKRSEDWSAAATALSQVQTSNGIFPKRRRASLAAAVQKSSLRQCYLSTP